VESSENKNRPVWGDFFIWPWEQKTARMGGVFLGQIIIL
jgi:hypothetical protein